MQLINSLIFLSALALVSGAMIPPPYAPARGIQVERDDDGAPLNRWPHGRDPNYPTDDFHVPSGETDEIRALPIDRRASPSNPENGKDTDTLYPLLVPIDDGVITLANDAHVGTPTAAPDADDKDNVHYPLPTLVDDVITTLADQQYGAIPTAAPEAWS